MLPQVIGLAIERATDYPNLFCAPEGPHKLPRIEDAANLCEPPVVLGVDIILTFNNLQQEHAKEGKNSVVIVQLCLDLIEKLALLPVLTISYKIEEPFTLESGNIQIFMLNLYRNVAANLDGEVKGALQPDLLKKAGAKIHLVINQLAAIAREYPGEGNMPRQKSLDNLATLATTAASLVAAYCYQFESTEA